MVMSDGTALVRFYDAPNPEAASQPTLYLKIEGVGKFAVFHHIPIFNGPVVVLIQTGRTK